MTPAQTILIEGADGTGKSTFVSRMVNMHLTDGTYIPRVIHNDARDHALPGSLYHHYRAQLLEAIHFRDLGISTYIDRSFLSELIYGPLYRGKSRISTREGRKLERLATQNDIALLGMTAEHAIRRSRIEARGEKFDAVQPFVAAAYSQHFANRAKHWVIADSSSAHVLN